MIRWNCIKNKRVKSLKKVEEYLQEIINLSKKYNLSLSHEDSMGCFIIENYDECNINWLMDCVLNIKEKEK